MNALRNSCKTRDTTDFPMSKSLLHIRKLTPLNQLIDGTINMNFYRYGLVVGGVLLKEKS
jgi:hypothetical protein